MIDSSNVPVTSEMKETNKHVFFFKVKFKMSANIYIYYVGIKIVV